MKTAKAVPAHRSLLRRALHMLHVICHIYHMAFSCSCSLSYPSHSSSSGMPVHPDFLIATPPVSPICPSLCPICPRYLGLTAVLLRTQCSRVMLPVHVYRQSPYNLPLAFVLAHILFSSCRQTPLLLSHPKGVLAALKLQLQKRIRAGVIP